MYKASYPMKPLKLLDYEINQRNLLLLLNYIEQLSQYKENIYKEPLIKLNLSLIIGFFTNRYSKKFVNTQEYFYLCLKELEKYYGINNNINETIFDIKWRNKAKKELSKFVYIKKENISTILSQVKIIYKNDYVELEKINRLFRECKEDKKVLTMKDFEFKYIKNEHNKNYIEKYLDNECSNSKEDEEIIKNKKNNLYKSILFEDILNADLTNIEDTLLFLYASKKYDEQKVNIDNIYNESKSNYKKLPEESDQDLAKELEQILNNKEFIDNFFLILQSNSVKNYLNNKRLFNNDNNSI